MLHSLMKRLHDPVYRARLAELVRQISPHLRPNDRILDVGCGFGALGRAILDNPTASQGIDFRGLESVKREGELIPITAYDGKVIPFADRSFDIVIVADVLHHEHDPDRLIAECRRITRRLLIIKDHKIDGFLAQQRISLIDWAANAPYGVPCLFRYNTPQQWQDCFQRNKLKVRAQLDSMKLYPAPYNLLFGRRLQYLAILEPQ